MALIESPALTSTDDKDAFAELLSFVDAHLHAAGEPVLGRGCWIYGAGGFGRRVAKELIRCGVPVVGFIDRRAATLRTVEGLPVVCPDLIATRDIDDTTYVHGLMNHLLPALDVVQWAKSQPFRRLVFPADLFSISGFQLDHYWLTTPAEMRARMIELQAIHNGMADRESRSLLRDIIRHRVTTDPRECPALSKGVSYAPDIVPLHDGPITLVDGGAYTGDTLLELLGEGILIRDWIAFEPDASNFMRLQETADACRDRIGAFTLLPFGLSDCHKRLHFAEGDGAISRVAGSEAVGSAMIDVVRMDDVIARQPLVYIKLDIEGSEFSALKGMTNLLRDGASLAVCIYHKPSDLWKIPSYLMKRYPTATFGLRQHAHSAFDTVLYMVQK